jgi:hypothetical protein
MVWPGIEICRSGSTEWTKLSAIPNDSRLEASMFRSSGFRHPPSFELVRGRFASFKGIREGFAPVTLGDVARISR